MRRALVLLPVLWMMSLLAAEAQQPQPVKIDLACTADLAIQRSLTIKASQQDIVTATKGVARAKSQERFSANATASYLHFNAPITLPSETLPVDGFTVTIPGQTVADQDVVFANVFAQYPIYNGSRYRYLARSATYGVSEAQNTAADTQLSVVFQTTRTYLSAIYGRENVRVNQESLKSYEEHLSQTQQLLKEGVATDYDINSAEAAVANQRKRLANACNQYELALANLRTALILARDVPLDLQGGFFEVPAERMVNQAEDCAVQAAPSLRSMAAKSCSLLWQERSVRAQLKPQLSFVGFGNALNRTNGFLTNAQWFVGLQATQVVFDGGNVRAQSEQIRSERASNDIQLNNASNDVMLSVRSAYLDMETACSAIAASRTSVEAAREALRLAERRYAEGVATSLEVLDANVSLLSAQTGLLQSYYQLDTAYLAAHRYLGDIVQIARCAQSAGAVGVDGATASSLPAATGRSQTP